ETDLVVQLQIFRHCCCRFMDFLGQCPERCDPQAMQTPAIGYRLPTIIIMLQHTKPNGQGLSVTGGCVQQAGFLFGNCRPGFPLEIMRYALLHTEPCFGQRIGIQFIAAHGSGLLNLPYDSLRWETYLSASAEYGESAAPPLIYGGCCAG